MIKFFFKVLYFINLVTVAVYYLFIKELLGTKFILMSFLPVIISLYRIMSYLKNKLIYHNISRTLLTDPIILISFIIWILTILINIKF